MLDILSRLPGRLLLLKALQKKSITIPAYTKADGTFVPAHTKLVNYNPDHHAVLSGKSSHSHNQAIKKLHKLVPGAKEMPAEHQSHIAQGIAQDDQTAATKAAQVSTFKKALLSGKKPKPAEIAAFKELQEADPQKASDILVEVTDKIGLDKYLELCGIQKAAPPPPPAGPTADELATAIEKLQEIASGAPGMKVGQQAYKLLEKDPAWLKKNAVERLKDVLAKWKDLQAAASHGAAVSVFTKKLAEGKVPSPSQMQAYAALDDAGKMKAIKAAIKKSGHKLSPEKINELLDQGAAKAGIEMVSAPKAAEPVAAPAAKHFGQTHEGKALGTGLPGSTSAFKFEGGKWQLWAGHSSGWSNVTNADWIGGLNAGIHPVHKHPLQPVDDPAKHFGFNNEGKTFAGTSGPYLFQFQDGEWFYKFKEQVKASDPWVKVENPEFLAKLDKGQAPTGGALSEVDTAPQPDDAQWGFNENDPGMSGHPTLTGDGPNGEAIYITGTDPADGGAPYSVGVFSDEAEEPEFTEFESPKRVQQFLQNMGVHPPEIASIEKLKAIMDGLGPHEGDTKQGVGGVLTLKDGHWTLDNAAVLSFWNKHAVSPGTPVAIASVGFLQEVAKGADPSVVMAQLALVKKAAQSTDYAPAQINDLINDLNAIYGPVLDHNTKVQQAASEPAYDHLLHNTSEGHNKFWQVVVDPAAKTATTIWGKIGAAKPQSKTYQHVSASAALKAAKDAVAAKKGKGYYTVHEKEPTQHVPAPAPAPSAKESFGQQNAGKIFSAPMSTGAQGFYKYEGGGWMFSFDPADGWDTVSSLSQLHDKLETGFNASGHPLVPNTAYDKPKWKFEAGQMFEAGYSTGSSTKWTFKYLGDGKWAQVIGGDEVEVTADAWLAALNSGKGLDSQPITEVASFGIGSTPADDGPKEGDVKPGKGGWLILKDGHWVKASEDEVLKKLCPVPESIGSSFFKQALAHVRDNGGKWKKVATTKIGMPNVTLTIEGFGKFVGKASKTDLGKAGEWKGWGSSLAGKNVADALNYLEHLKEAQKAIAKGKLPPDSPFAGQEAPAAPTAAPAAPAAPAPAPAAAGPIPSIDGWKKIGEQGGFNPGGTFTDPDGVQWYCKFPAGGAKIARNELLANKLYAEAGVEVPEVKLVTQGGKVGIASKIVEGAKQDKAALQAGKGDGLISGFVADAWLANWDVVGNNPAAGKGWDNIMFKDGKAVRIDPGGALLYGGAGGKKTAFGDQVIELDTMRDSSVNARTAKVFGGISAADLKASAAKVLAISDSKIDALVEAHGPGDAAEKAALAQTLKARKAHIASKFPTVAKKVATQGMIVIHPHEMKAKGKPKLDPKNLPVKVSDLPKPNDYMNWNGTGKPISDKPYVLQNIVDEKAIFDFAMKGNLIALKEYKFQPVDKMTGEPVGAPKSMEQHPSQYVRAYYDSVVQFLEVVANPMAPLELPIAKNVSTVDQLAEAFPSFNYGKNIASVPSNHRLGFWFGLGFVDNWADIVPKTLNKPITQSVFQKAVDLWNKAPKIMRDFLKDVKGSGSANQPYRDGKVMDNDGRNCREVLRACYDFAMEHEEGTTIFKKIKMPKAMIDEFLKQPPGLVFQNPGSMCCSRKKLSGFGENVLTIHYAKGAKANDNMGWGKSFSGTGADSEQEITSLAGARFMVMSRQMVGGQLHMELLMLPPDPLYVANLKESA